MYVPQPDGRAQTPSSGPVVMRRPASTPPDWHELLAAFCGHIGDQPEDHPVTRWARALAELHLARREQPLHAAEIDCRRNELVARIDDWIGANTTRGPRSESLGAVVDGMAAAQVRATHLLRSVDDVTDERVHAAWFLLASMADGWTDLVEQAFGIRPTARRIVRGA
ncbi:DUF4254 domain-containing protein [Nocardia sp. CDC159]|uniref:DUF4254 domain-containing protein n=1 Tax=Nocardia pulmonis TaxID=2951408 RepID=A0A9X2EG25_9NOCA|nr:MULTISPECIES: DUF4254 domain-containing protein [Nocardia]MCM6777616.1 DUF4254 domain-containing protein [Nocardia pulmonis]MCM6790580.1 DUF4254 domain-containing protein [Nocardia sp. CDC159]